MALRVLKVNFVIYSLTRYLAKKLAICHMHHMPKQKQIPTLLSGWRDHVLGEWALPCGSPEARLRERTSPREVRGRIMLLVI